MQFTHLGRTGLTVSRLCLGTMNFGPETDEADLVSIMDSALEAGSTSSTRPTSTAAQGRGATEEIVGRWFAQGGGRREKVVLATKVYGDMGDWPNEGKLSALHIRRACEASLKRLQTDYIDLYQMHHIDRRTGWDEIWQAMEVLAPRARCSTSARRISPAGTSPRPRRRPPGATSWAWSASRRTTTC